jgi:hypothetical protein
VLFRKRLPEINQAEINQAEITRAEIERAETIRTELRGNELKQTCWGSFIHAMTRLAWAGLAEAPKRIAGQSLSRGGSRGLS